MSMVRENVRGKKAQFFKVRELSGNFDIGRGILHIHPRVRQMSGNSEKTGLRVAKYNKNNDCQGTFFMFGLQND